MGIACDIPENLFGPVERSFAVNDPFGASERREVAKEGSPRSQRLQGRKELQVARVKGVLQGFEEQAPEQAAQHLDRQEEIRSAEDPTRSVERQTSTGDHNVQMRVPRQRLPPGMKHAEKADLAARCFGSAAIVCKVWVAVRKRMSYTCSLF